MSNILLHSHEEGHLDVRIADFGLAQVVREGEILTRKCGTPTYIAPEMLASDFYDFKVDIFSLGSIMFNLS